MMKGIIIDGILIVSQSGGNDLARPYLASPRNDVILARCTTIGNIERLNIAGDLDVSVEFIFRGFPSLGKRSDNRMKSGFTHL